jgi:Flp pilus assembly protein TadG
MLRRCTRAAAALEFAFVAPILLMLCLATIDAARALIISQQLNNAANAIAQAAEKLSVTVDPTTGALTSELTAAQMQQAMSTIYAEIPGLNLGNGGGLLSGGFAVGLSSITYTPACAATTGCASQTPAVLWTSALSAGGPNLTQFYFRPCSYPPQQVAHMPNTSTLGALELPSPVLAGGAAMTMVPQVVADIAYSFTPWFPAFNFSAILTATASFPAPIGALDAQVALNTGASTAGVVSCS